MHSQVPGLCILCSLHVGVPCLYESLCYCEITCFLVLKGSALLWASTLGVFIYAVDTPHTPQIVAHKRSQFDVQRTDLHERTHAQQALHIGK